MVYFCRPVIHSLLKTWSASIVIPVGNYFISYAGDDGNNRKDNDVSIRHYLMIWHKDNPHKDLTEDLGFESYGNIDLLTVIDTLRNTTLLDDYKEEIFD